MENSIKYKRGEKEEMKGEANESGAGNVHMMGSASGMNPGSGIEHKMADLEISGAGAVSGIETAIETNTSRTIKPPVFNNRFTRMELNKESLIRTDKGFLHFFNLNSHLTLKECWKEQSVKQDKGDLEKKD